MTIKIKTEIISDIKHAWNCFSLPEHIVNWNFASQDWKCPKAENDLKVGGKFNYRMEAEDGSFGFDFWGIYDEIIPYEKIAYTLGDNRKVEIRFKSEENSVIVEEDFDTEDENTVELQRAGWQAILDNFKKHAEKQ